MPNNNKNILSGEKIIVSAEKTSQIKPDSRIKPKREIKVLEKKLSIIRNTYKTLIFKDGEISPAFEWLYDNYYILEREGRKIIRELSRGCKLPSVDSKALILIHAEKFCEAAAGNITAENIEKYIETAQKNRPFESCELCALDLMLRATLIEEAAKGCEIRDDEKRRELFSDAIKTLNFLNTFDFSEIVERQSLVERILNCDPAGVYSKMDERSRFFYRRRVEKIAEKLGLSESETAEMAVTLAKKGKTERERHVGFYLIDTILGKKKPDTRGKTYLTLLWSLPLLVSLVVALLLKMPWLIVILYFPVWEIIRPITEYFSMRKVEPNMVPKMDLKGVVPESAPTLVTVSALLTSPGKASDYAKKIEQYYYANGRGSIMFCVLADLKEAKLPEKPEDKAIREAAVREIAGLNKKYGNHFCLVLRNRRYSKTQDCFSGWERKRGAIIELTRMIRGEKTSIGTFEGDLASLQKTKYIIALDSDTGLIMDTAAEMVSAAVHPLNRPVIENGIVKAGYGILAPRISVDIDSAAKTPFSRIMAGAGGVTAYDSTAGDVWQDIFGESIFAGKGIIDVDAFYEVLDKALPENKILSHDIIEGTYLRTGYLSNIELTDGFPARPEPWFDRLHRWIRGDWQNIRFIFDKGSDKKETPFGGLGSFHLFDNLRRSLTPIFAFTLLVIAAFLPFYKALTLIIAAFLSLAGSGLLTAIFAVVRGGPSMLSRKYHCRVLPQAVDALAQCAFSYLFLPDHALLCFDAILRACARLISGKKLLEWVTAAESESKKSSRNNAFSASARRFAFSFLVGVAGVIFAFSAPCKIAAAFFLITPLVAWLSGIPTPPIKDDLSDSDTDRLHSYTAAMWRFYDEFVNAEENFLPPDNFQEAPISVVAHRTSPTNIGLMLLSTLAARDLKLITTETLFNRIENSLTTIEKLEKWKGHLLNWYNTKTLESLTPRYVSTVDSGNFLCCLVALKEGLKDYENESGADKSLNSRIETLIDDCDLGALYNPKRKLFHLGFDLEKDALSDIYYDMLMSEARMTSYFAIAKRIVPKRHWGALGRTLTKHNGYTGPVSWTGTMFEYLMPHLLLPVYEDSMAAEALRFVIYCQKRRVRERGLPWGISESGFYSFDADLNYQYEANGVRLLALKRGMDSDLVISPYSTFLALPFDRVDGMKNLRRLENLGMYGHCGFFEAADFSYRRTGGRMATVKSFMAHHVGMSIVASDNALNDCIMQERFMRNKEMRAARDLLLEKIPSDAVVFRDVQRKDEPDKPPRYSKPHEDFSDVSPISPRCDCISNGEYTMVLTDCGASYSLFHTLDLTRKSTDILCDPTGIFAIASFGSEKISATAAPKYQDKMGVKRRVGFNETGAVYYARSKDYGISMTAALSSETPTEVRYVEAENFTSKRTPLKLLFYFEPALAKTADVEAHPAFSRLFLSVNYRSDIKALVFTRRTRGKEVSASIAVGFEEIDADFEFDGDRGIILTRPYGTASLENSLDSEFSNRTGALTDAAAAIRVSSEIAPHQKKKYTLLISAAPTADEAVTRLIRERRRGFHTLLRNAASKNSDMVETRLASLILPQIIFPVEDTVTLSRENSELKDLRKKANKENTLGKEGLWQLGISGDFPIVLFQYNSMSDLEHLEPYVRMHRLLNLRGIKYDLVITYKEDGDYNRSSFDAVKRCVRLCGCEYLVGTRGGVHMVNLARFPHEVETFLISSSCHIASETVKQVFVPFRAQPFRASYPIWKGEEEVPVFGGGFSGDSFTVSHIAQSPSAPWCHIIASRTFGTLVSDRALGFTWALNARENKLTPWKNDTAADNRGEMLIVKVGMNFYDVCANARVTFSIGKAVFESEQDDFTFKVTVTVPEKAMAKIIDLEIKSEKNNDVISEIVYYTEPVLGVSRETERHIKINARGNVAILSNPWSSIKGVSFLSCDDEKATVITSRGNFFAGSFHSDDEYTPDPCCAMKITRRLHPSKLEKMTFFLGFSGEEKAAEKTIELLKEHREEPLSINTNWIKIKTPDERLDKMVNTWLPNQFLGSRINGRTGFYQCGGAYGFRDQLQDCCAAMLVDRNVAKTHIYRCAAHQFREGDVMHWWHQLPLRDGGSKGVRTRCSDDLLWLVYTVALYLEKTGDYSLFDHEIYYLSGDELREEEDDRYFTPPRSDEKENVYKHCVRAIMRSLTKGSHGIPLFGNGDWNDGMNLVGIKGKGESVWLAMFEICVFKMFIPIAEKMNDAGTVDMLNKEIERLTRALNENCWDGEWYARGFFDDGTPLGVHTSSECRIDILPQSFATISDLPDSERRKMALDSMVKYLVDNRLELVRLFDPPFDNGTHNPGYIRSYSPGIRENGGQYTHAAVWAALSLLIDGRSDEGYKILSWINPAKRTETTESAKVYRLEPFSITADISTNPAVEGRGGWSLYTGAAGWYYRTVIEYLLGIKLSASKISLSPSIPQSWDGFEAKIIFNETEVELKVLRSESPKGLSVDGEKKDYIPLDKKPHKATFEIKK